MPEGRLSRLFHIGSELRGPEREVVDPQKHIIVEVGCGHKPFPFRYGGRQLRQSDVYYGIDLFTKVPRDRKRALLRETRDWNSSYGTKQINLRERDARYLPFDDGVVGDIIYPNVFGDKDTQDRESLIKEGVRVMRPDYGQITVVETYTPQNMPLEELRELMGKHGLIQFNIGSEGNLDMIGKYSDYTRPGSRSNEGNEYIAIFIKDRFPHLV